MAFFLRRSVKRRGDGNFDLRIGTEERELLVRLMDDFQTALDEEADDPSLRRLFPPTYGDDAVLEAGFQMMAGDDLRRSRIEAAATVAESARRDRLTEDEAVALAQALNAVRLVLGTRLDIDEEGGEPPPPDDPSAPAWHLYHYLSALLGELVDALAG
ncbi:MAG TPA: DUF2017 family protein [Acidimicrobiales bacterium]|nr:DUF2017 family protein [Acidimicrobiales bacterium]